MCQVAKCRIGFLVNPIAGMGGAVGLKGTDGRLYVEALERGAKPVAPARAVRFLDRLQMIGSSDVELALAGGIMGCDYLSSTLLRKHVCLDIPASNITTREDTLRVVREFIRLKVDAIVFVGGDGTARDVLEASNSLVPILGVPSGVKVYSSVFAISPEAAAEILLDYCRGEGVIEVGEVVDVDEYSLQRDILSIRSFGKAYTLSSKNLRVSTKEFGSTEDLESVAEHFIEEVYRPGAVFIFGPGSTTKAIVSKLGIDKTLLGFDAVLNGELIGKDLTAREIEKIVKEFKDVYIVLSVIGGQGYLIGRGNQQLTPEILKTLGRDRIIVVSSRSKFSKLRYLLIDSGDLEVDRDLSGYYRVIVEYGETYLIKALPASDPAALR
ncbi:MAG: ATP-NAD kinase family protein [Sulfolobales archaeon]|nr:ATP-NAD kinase family protein [Sulfolobales archaeon]MDW8083272.1 ATP-NAD kinase family protein [Sulfolobales archaeon]